MSQKTANPSIWRGRGKRWASFHSAQPTTVALVIGVAPAFVLTSTPSQQPARALHDAEWPPPPSPNPDLDHAARPGAAQDWRRSIAASLQSGMPNDVRVSSLYMSTNAVRTAYAGTPRCSLAKSLISF